MADKRLIDANELLKTGSGIKIAIRNDCHPYEAIRIQGNAFRKAVEEAPTVDAVEVVHGRWIKTVWRTKCSVCGFSGSLFDDPINPFNYCPNCGAKMDGERSEGE